MRRIKTQGGSRLKVNYSVYLEYAMLAALIGIIGGVAVWKYGDEIKNFFEKLTQKTTEASNKIK